MQEYKYYYMYEIRNLETGSRYIGVHRTNDLDDGYFGSGIRLKAAIKKYGRERFEKVILEFFNSVEDMFARETEIVTEAFTQREDVYNLAIGGYGGTNSTERATARYQWLKENDPEWNDERLERLAKTQAHNAWLLENDPEYRAMLAEKHRINLQGALSDKARRKRKETFAKIGHSRGEKNSQFGTMWITNGIESKKIRKDEPIPEGWGRGRKIKSAGVSPHSDKV